MGDGDISNGTNIIARCRGRQDTDKSIIALLQLPAFKQGALLAQESVRQTLPNPMDFNIRDIALTTTTIREAILT